MIVFRRTSPEEVREAHRLHELQFPSPGSEVPKAANGDNLHQLLTEPPPLVWDGVRYTIPRVPYLSGVRLSIIAQKSREALGEELTEEAQFQQIEYWREACDLMWGMLSPKPPENPFLDASPSEVGELISFFLIVLTIWKGESRLTTTLQSPRTTSTSTSHSSMSSRN